MERASEEERPSTSPRCRHDLVQKQQLSTDQQPENGAPGQTQKGCKKALYEMLHEKYPTRCVNARLASVAAEAKTMIMRGFQILFVVVTTILPVGQPAISAANAAVARSSG